VAHKYVLLELVGALACGVDPVLGRDGLQAVEEGVIVQAAEVLWTGLLKQGKKNTSKNEHRSI
jgi:hypothetical protein